MARNRKQPSRTVGSQSPASESAKEQSISGYKGGPRGERPAGSGRQPPQSSGRRAKAHEPEPDVRRNFEPEDDPDLQGAPHQSPDKIRQSPSLQGHAGRSHSGGTRAGDSEEEAGRGSPRSGHTRHGRQNLPGDRSR